MNSKVNVPESLFFQNSLYETETMFFFFYSTNKSKSVKKVPNYLSENVKGISFSYFLNFMKTAKAKLFQEAMFFHRHFLL